ncbi:EAL domain-containing protein [Vibrio vulnificus]|uniref:EAL domain-containing protein n=1 Tax=Vibrio vulnificus TaxID=672 RepID=UPI00102A8E8C|nr:EAL domain-containing protein [Vibrio vulnificus]RZP61093.1 EAL domain-containing protein [Vibrio vulnificus]
MSVIYSKANQTYQTQILDYIVGSRFQNIVDIKGRVIAKEALLKVADQEGRHVTLDCFFGQLSELSDRFRAASREKINLMHLVNFRYAVDYSVNQKLFINVSPLAFQFIHDRVDLLDSCISAIHSVGMKPSQVVAEILEDHCDINTLEKFFLGVYKLRNRGVGIALDDYGVGYSNMARVAALNPDYIKVSRELLLKCLRSNIDCLKELMVVSRMHGTKVIIEGVETDNELLFAQQNDAAGYQGFLFSKPRTLVTDDLYKTR